MNYNPYSARILELTNLVSSTSEQAFQHKQALEWYDGFSIDEAASVIGKQNRAIKSHLEKLGSLVEMEAQSSAKIDRLREEVRLGFDPRYWFSDERKIKQQELAVAQHENAQRALQIREHRSAIQRARAELDLWQSKLNRYRAFDPLEAQATITALNSQIQQSALEIEGIRPHEVQLDEQLREPLLELRKLESQQKDIEISLNQAELFDQSLSNAANSYERRMIHEKCSVELGDAKPGNFINKKKRELEQVTRSVKKLDERLRKIGKRTLHPIKVVVIDGNNMCYEQNTFIGLSALLPSSRRLAASYSVTVVFDASIRGLLKMRDHDISAKFDNAIKIHVVASKTKADETILDIASASDSIVVSNDRFAEFPDKLAVRDQRLIRHEILNGNILVHELNIAEKF